MPGQFYGHRIAIEGGDQIDAVEIGQHRLHDLSGDGDPLSAGFASLTELRHAGSGFIRHNEAGDLVV